MCKGTLQQSYRAGWTFAKLTDACAGGGPAGATSNPLVISGKSGLGKSTLLAVFARRSLTAPQGLQPALHLHYFIGLSKVLSKPCACIRACVCDPRKSHRGLSLRVLP